MYLDRQTVSVLMQTHHDMRTDAMMDYTSLTVTGLIYLNPSIPVIGC